MNNIQVSPNFKLREFQCKCCGSVKIHSDLLEKAQRLRDKYGAFTPNSGYRCPAHNKAVGGSANSYHMKGMAVDVPLKAGWTVERLAKLGEEVGFTGIGLYKWGCHFDIRPGKWRQDNR